MGPSGAERTAPSIAAVIRPHDPDRKPRGRDIGDDHVLAMIKIGGQGNRRDALCRYPLPQKGSSATIEIYFGAHGAFPGRIMEYQSQLSFHRP